MRRQAGLCLSLVALSLVSQGEAFSVGVAAPRALSHTSIALRSPIRPMYAPARRAPAALRMQADSEKGSPLDSIAKPALWAGFAAYMFIVFASDAPCGPGATGDLCGISLPTMMEAINLSINFWSAPRSKTREKWCPESLRPPGASTEVRFRPQVCDPAGVPYHGA